MALLAWLAKREVARMDKDNERRDGEIEKIKNECLYKDTYEAAHKPLADAVTRIENKLDQLLLRK